MAKGRELKGRIKSVENTRKITRTMEMVATSKMKRAQDRVVAARPYARALGDVIASLYTPELAERFTLLRQPAHEGRAAVVLLTSNRGLAGAFNASVLRRAIDEAAAERAAGREIVWYAAGRKGAGSLRFRGAELREVWTGFTDRPVYQDAEQIANTLIEQYGEGEFDRLIMVFNHFDSPLVQTVHADEVLPIPLPAAAAATEGKAAVSGELLFEPEAETMLGPLLTTALETEIAVCDGGAVWCWGYDGQLQLGTASDNAADLIDRLTLDMNRARQAEITQQLLEVVAGADALS